MNQEILTESGTNEMELLVFSVSNTDYGINVAKVRELIPKRRVTAVPYAPAHIDGTFILRDQILTQVNLATALNVTSRSETGGQLIIVELNGQRCGVLVDGVDRIHRLGWSAIKPPSDMLLNSGAPITATAQVGERVILILDFELILGDLIGINDPSELSASDSEGGKLADTRILVVDDSALVRNKVSSILSAAGCTDYTVSGNGVEAMAEIAKAKAAGNLFDIVLSDIEMPQMDGLRLTKTIKNDPELRRMPVLLFSSLISEENLNKGRAVGADGQVTKFQGDILVSEIVKQLASVPTS